MNLTRDLYIPLLDGNKIRRKIGVDEVGEGYDWVRIDKSTTFVLAFNPQEETFGYIDTANDTTEVRSYQPELPEEIILDNENPLYSILQPWVMSMPTGGDAKVPCLLVLPDMTSGEPTEGYLWEECILSPGELGTDDGKLTFTCKLNGTPKKGTVTFGGGKATFNDAAAMSLSAKSPAKLKDL